MFSFSKLSKTEHFRKIRRLTRAGGDDQLESTVKILQLTELKGRDGKMRPRGRDDQLNLSRRRDKSRDVQKLCLSRKIYPRNGAATPIDVTGDRLGQAPARV